MYYYALVISPFSWRAFKYLTEIKAPKTIRKDSSFILDEYENFFSIARCVGCEKNFTNTFNISIFLIQFRKMSFIEELFHLINSSLRKNIKFKES